MMTRPDPWTWLERAAAACDTDAEALAGSEAVSLMLRDAGEQLAALRADADATLALCRGEDGPAHDRVFTMEVRLNSNVLGKGTGHSKREAEQYAARMALEYFEDEDKA